MLLPVSLSSPSLVNCGEPAVFNDIRAIIYDHYNRDAELAYLLRILNIGLGCVSSVVVSVLFADDVSM